MVISLTFKHMDDAARSKKRSQHRSYLKLLLIRCITVVNRFMVSITSVKSSSIQHDARFVNNPIFQYRLNKSVIS